MMVRNLELAGLLCVCAVLFLRMTAHRRWRAWERDRRHELEAYCTLEIKLPTHGEARKRTERAKRVARLVTERSVFARCALFLQNEDGQLACMGSCGMDDLSLDALDSWCERCLREEGSGLPRNSEQLIGEARRSFAVPLAPEEGLDGMRAGSCATATLIPVRLQRGRLVGLLAVCGMRVPELDAERAGEALAPLELLAAKLARTIERSMLMDRLIHMERLAGAAQLAAGAAEALVDPLRAVRDRSELIAGTSTETRIREHARSLLAEAQQMSETLEALRGAWRPREEAPPAVQERRGRV